MSWRRVLGCSLAVMVLGACGSGEDEERPRPGQLVLREGQSIDQAPECSDEAPQCDAGLDCIKFELDDVFYARCLPLVDLCQEFFACTGDTVCITFTSDPPILACDTP